jgi:tetratricopeptide (TPR) repeat protein
MRRDRLIYLALTVITLALFWQVTRHEFLNYDDYRYVTGNPRVQGGLAPDAILWAFTANDASNWHPLTWLSHMLDVQLYGLDPRGHHLTNLLLHLADTLLLFAVLKRMTGAVWRSAFVAALFAVHPLHVESVAWVAERKDVLSTLFWILTMWAYLRYVERPNLNGYLQVVFAFALGLMAKPMLVTLPFVLLLLDYWPLKRMRVGGGRLEAGGRKVEAIASNLKPQTGRPASLQPPTSNLFGLFVEKMPLFFLSAASSVMTYVSQSRGGAIYASEALGFGVRVENAILSYVRYIGKMIWPVGLSAFYPHPGEAISIWQVVGSALMIAGVTILVLKQAERRPYLAVGWFWYLGTLVPVIGVLQVGGQAMADRYTYVPLIGLFILIVWGIADLTAGWSRRAAPIGVFAGVVLTALMALSWVQIGYWRNDATLFRHALEVTTGNYIAHDSLGFALIQQGKVEEGIAHYREAFRINPKVELTSYNLAAALVQQGKVEEGIGYYQRALRIHPDNETTRNSLGAALAEQGKLEAAISQYREALRINPDFEMAHNNLGMALVRQGKFEEAVAQYQEALRIRPDYALAHGNLGAALAQQGKSGEAIAQFREALRIDPKDELAQSNLGSMLLAQGKIEEAVAHFEASLRINPQNGKTHYNLGLALAREGKPDAAIAHLSESIGIDPNDATAHGTLGAVYQNLGRLDDAIDEYQTALRINPRLAQVRNNLEAASREKKGPKGAGR